MGICGNKIKWQIPSDKVLIFYYKSKEDQTNQILGNLVIKNPTLTVDLRPQSATFWFDLPQGFSPLSFSFPSEI